MFKPLGYISPVDKAKQYLSSMQINPEDQSFIDQSIQQGFDENMYLPAIASKKMREQDTELQSRYTEYKKSPTTFMSNFKADYGEKNRWWAMDAIGFVTNLFVDLWENVEELGKAVLNPVDTIKWLGRAAANPIDTGKAIIWALKENFGSLEKAKETFYENPFDVLSVVIPVAKVAKVGKLASATSKATKLDVALNAAKATKFGSGIASQVAKHSGLIDKLADITNWDINLMSSVAKRAAKAWGGARDLASSLIYGTKGKSALKNLWEATKDPARRAALEWFRNMDETQIVNTTENALAKTEKMAKSELDNAVMQSSELGVHEFPEKFVDKSGSLKTPGSKKPLYQTSWSLETDFSVGNIKDMSKWNFIKVAEKGIDQTEDALQAQNLINGTMQKYGMGKDWMKNFDPAKTQQVLDGINKALKGDLVWAKISTETQRIVQQYSKWLKKAQSTSYPLIKKAREWYKEFDKFTSEIEKEISSGTGRKSTIINRLTNVWNNESIKKAIKYINEKSGTNLEDISTALLSEKLLGPGAKNALFLGTAWSAINPAVLVPAVAYTAFTSPALLYKLAKLTGGARNAAGRIWTIVKDLAKKTGLKEWEIESALTKLRNSPNADTFFDAVKSMGKWAMSRRWISLMERIQHEIEQQYSQQSDAMQPEIQQMEDATKNAFMNSNTPEQPMQEVETSIAPIKYREWIGTAGFR